jgi:hypothetical protein
MALTLQFTPRVGIGSDDFFVLDSMSKEEDPLTLQRSLHALALELHCSSIQTSDCSIARVQTGLSILLYDNISEGERDHFYDTALQDAFKLKLHRVDSQFTPSLCGFQEESMVRCW